MPICTLVTLKYMDIGTITPLTFASTMPRPTEEEEKLVLSHTESNGRSENIYQIMLVNEWL